MMHFRRGLVASGITLLVLASGCHRPPAPPPPPPGPTPAQVRAAVDSQFRKLCDAYRARDGVSIAAIYATDGESRSPRSVLIGRPMIQAALQRDLVGVRSLSIDTAVTTDVIVAGDRAIQSGDLVWTATNVGGKPFTARVDFVYTWRRDPDGGWRIVRDLDFQTLVHRSR